MLSILCVRLTIKVKVGIPESFKVGWYPHQKKLGQVTLNSKVLVNIHLISCILHNLMGRDELGEISIKPYSSVIARIRGISSVRRQLINKRRLGYL